MTFTANTLPRNFTPTPPNLKDLLDLFGQNLMIDFNCHHIASIQSFDEVTQTASVTINYQKTYYNLNQQTQQYDPVQVAYPILMNCPVVILSGGSCALTMPISPGDDCIVLFNDRDIDNWYNGSTNSGVATNRLHSFSDGLILVGIRSLANSLLAYDTTRALIRAGTVPGSIVAVGANPSGKALITNTYPTNSVTLGTTLQQLCANIQNLISALTTNAPTFIAATGSPGGPSPLNPAIATALAAVSTSLSTVTTTLQGLLE